MRRNILNNRFSVAFDFDPISYCKSKKCGKWGSRILR